MPENSIKERFKNAWSAFLSNKDPTHNSNNYGGYYYRPDRLKLNYGNERSIITSVYNRISVDAASIDIKHVRIDENERYSETVESNFNSCLNYNANKDQTGRAFIQDVVLSMLDEGVVAIIPTDTTANPNNTDSYDILELRTAKIIQWYPDTVKVELYNEDKGKKEEITLRKSVIAIIENPFYSVMNAPNSTMRRLSRKLALLDMTDERNSSGKLDLIVQLPYVVKSPARKQQAEERRKDIEMQLAGTKYGIAYTDGTEKITQLNRSIDNQLMSQVESLTSMLYSQLGITAEILNGTANEQAMLNYNSRIIEPIISAITDEMSRKFISKTARTQGQTIMFFRDPFKLVPINNIADIADKFTRNEILSSNELRGIIGFLPSTDPNADELRNKNLNQPEGAVSEDPNQMDSQQYQEDSQSQDTEQDPFADYDPNQDYSPQ